MVLKVGILLFDEVEVLDYCGPFEVFSVTRHLNPETFGKVELLAEKSIITTRGGMRVVVDHVIGNAKPQLDVLLVPGGYGTRQLVKNENVLKWIKDIRPSVKYVLSVCTGVSVLGACGLLEGLVVTTHHLTYKELTEANPKSHLCTCRRFIDSNPIYTSAGISAGIDLSVYFVEKHFGREVAASTVKHMEYSWTHHDVRPSACTCGAEGKSISGPTDHPVFLSQ